MMKNLHFIFITLFLWVLVGGCRQSATNPYQEQDAFFGQPRFKGNYFKTFNLLEADTVVQHIRTEVPPQWQGWACQGAYYNLEGEEGVTDSILFRFLDVIGKAFPADSTVAFTEMIRGETFAKIAQYDTARVCFQKAYDLCLKIPNAVLASSVINGFADLALQENDYPEATRLLLNNYQYFSQLDTSMEKGRLFNILKKLSSVYTKSQDYKEAHKWCLKTYAYAMTDPDERRTLYAVESATFLARSYIALQEWDSAQIMLDTVVYFQTNHGGNHYDEDLRMSLRAKIQLGKGNCNAALPLFLAAKRTQKDPTNFVRIHRYNKELADAYVCQGRLDSAIYLYKTALATPDTFTQVAVLKALSKAYTLRGDYRAAYDYIQQSSDLGNRIFTKDKEQAIGRLQAKAEVERREKQLLAQESNNRLNRVLMLGAFGALLFLIMLSLSLYRRKQQDRRLADQEKLLLQQQKQLAEADALLKEQGLRKAEAELTIAHTQLEETMQLLDFKNKLIEELQMKDAQHTAREEGGQSLETAELKNLKILTTDDWRSFRTLFEQRFPHFFTHLNQHYPKLSVAETRLFLLIKLGFDSNEMSEVLGISGTSVYVGRSRLRHRLALDKEADLERFIQGF